MAEKIREGRRGNLGFGSSYHRANRDELGKGAGIGSVLGGQVWVVKPDKEAKTANPCIWMQAGVVEFKNCNNFCDCTTCKYDLGMRKKVEKGQQISWQDAMRMREGLDRICRHSLTMRIENRACAYDYACSTCDFDQAFEDVISPKTGSIPQEIREIKGFQVPMGYYYHNGHTWARIESGGFVRIGMDDFSMKLLGRADALDLPLMGKELDGGKAGWGLKRSANRADFLSPVDGVITEVNSEIREHPAMAHEAPYKDGWLFTIRTPDIKKTMKTLMSDTQGVAWINQELDTLDGLIEDVAGPLAADGGYLADDIYGAIPDLGWGNLTQTFLRT